jgi:hypothetical protein
MLKLKLMLVSKQLSSGDFGDLLFNKFVSELRVLFAGLIEMFIEQKLAEPSVYS